jgi:hypothetical protein
MAKPSGVSIWADEFRAGAFPPICVKSGQPADSKLLFMYSTTKRPWYGGPVAVTVGAITQGLLAPDLVSSRHRATGRLPLTRRWRRIFIGFRAIGYGSLATGVVAIVSAVVWGWPQWIIAFGFGFLGASFAAFVLYGGARPKGVVLRGPSGHEFVHLWDVHPNFVAGVVAGESQAPPS